jgi:hypothetical protein
MLIAISLLFSFKYEFIELHIPLCVFRSFKFSNSKVLLGKQMVANLVKKILVLLQNVIELLCLWEFPNEPYAELLISNPNC